MDATTASGMSRDDIQLYIVKLERELAEARERGYILAMRLLQSDIVLDDAEIAARDAFIEALREL